jgi:tetratricopeptide (TPR) repeat protein
MKNAMSGVDIHRGLAPAYQARSGSVEPVASEPGARTLALAPVEGIEGALADLRPALRADPSDATGHANRGLVLARRAAQLASGGWPGQAIEVWGSAAEACRAALVLEGDLLEARNNLGVVLSERARILGEQGRAVEAARDRTQAVTELDRVILSDPRSPLGWLNRGVVRRRTNRGQEEIEGARSDLARALELAGEPRMRSVVEAAIAAAAVSPSGK